MSNLNDAFKPLDPMNRLQKQNKKQIDTFSREKFMFDNRSIEGYNVDTRRCPHLYVSGTSQQKCGDCGKVFKNFKDKKAKNE